MHAADFAGENGGRDFGGTYVHDFALRGKSNGCQSMRVKAVPFASLRQSAVQTGETGLHSMWNAGTRGKAWYMDRYGRLPDSGSEKIPEAAGFGIKQCRERRIRAVYADAFHERKVQGRFYAAQKLCQSTWCNRQIRFPVRA